jgi:hypothetical protein
MAAPNLSIVPRNDDREFIAAFRASPSGQKIRAEQQAAETKRRALLAAEIASLDEKAERELPSLGAAARAAEAEVRRLHGIILGGFPVTDTSMTMQRLEALTLEKAKARGALSIAGHELAVARAKSADASMAYSSRRAELEQQLRATANPAIKIFRGEIFEAEQATRRTSNLDAREFTKGDRRFVLSNAPSIGRRLASLREARRQIDDLELRPDQTDIDIELERIRQSWPPIGVAEVHK